MWRHGLALSGLAAVAGCSFPSSSGGNDAVTRDAANGVDARTADARPIDAPEVTPIDAPPPPQRTRRGLVLRYDFNELGAGDTIADVSGVGTPANLRVGPLPVDSVLPTVDGMALTTTTPNVLVDVANSDAAAKIANACTNGEFSIEIWAKQRPGSASYGRLFSIGSTADLGLRNAQVGTTFQDATASFLRTTASTTSGQEVDIATAVDATQKQLFVMRYGGGKLVADVFTGTTRKTESVSLMGNFSSWAAYKLVLLNSNRHFNNNDARYWLGSIYSMSVYCSTLTELELENDRLLGSESL